MRLTYILMVILVIHRAESDKYAYETEFVSDICQVSNSVTRRTLTFPEGYSGITVQLTSSKIEPAYHDVYNTSCYFEVRAPQDFSLLVVVEDLNFRKDLKRGCIDYVKFGSDNFETEPLCGSVLYSGDVLVKPGSVKPRNDYHTPYVFQSTSQGVIKTYLKIGQELKKVDLSMKLVFTTFEGCISEFGTWTVCPAHDTLCINENVKCLIVCPFGHYIFGTECRPLPTERTWVKVGEPLNVFKKESKYYPMIFIFVCSSILYLFICFVCVKWRQALKARRHMMAHRRLHPPPARLPTSSQPSAAVRHIPQVTFLDDMTVILPHESPLPVEIDMTDLGDAADQCICPPSQHDDPPPSYAQVHSDPPPPYKALFPDVVAGTNT